MEVSLLPCPAGCHCKGRQEPCIGTDPSSALLHQSRDLCIWEGEEQLEKPLGNVNTIKPLWCCALNLKNGIGFHADLSMESV